MNRREFGQLIGAAACTGGLFATGCSDSTINKRNAFLEFIHGSGKQTYFPGAFFTHFPVADHFGPTAVIKHLEYFRATDADILKVQYERKFPLIESLQRPADWSSVPLLKKDFYAEQLNVIEGIVAEGKNEALVIPTVYPPLAFAGHFTDYKHHINHLNEDPEAVKKGLEIITESTIIFVRECAKLGVDGFFQASQGGEANRFVDERIFHEYVKPFELAIASEIASAGECNILHIHNAGEGYRDYAAFVDYPCHVINCGLQLHDSETTSAEIYDLFEKPFLGGLEREGVVYSGSIEEIQSRVKSVIADAPPRFALGATCTLPRDVSWDNIRVALDTAHAHS